MKIYTKTGDKGETTLFGGRRITKTDKRIHAYGEIDELNAHVGLIIAQTTEKTGRIQKYLFLIQEELLIIGSHLATPYKLKTIPDTLPIFSEHTIIRLEKEIDTITQELSELKHFIRPGGTILASELHIARTICRRAERSVISLSHNEEIHPAIIQYLNRLSDYLFTLARLANHITNTQESQWIPKTPAA